MCRTFLQSQHDLQLNVREVHPFVIGNVGTEIFYREGLPFQTVVTLRGHLLVSTTKRSECEGAGSGREGVWILSSESLHTVRTSLKILGRDGVTYYSVW